MLALYMFIVGVLLLSTTIRIRGLVKRVGVFVRLRLGMLIPISVLNFMRFCKNRAFLKSQKNCRTTGISPVGQCFPDARRCIFIVGMLCLSMVF